MNGAVQFDELRWLLTLSPQGRKKDVPVPIETKLVQRGLVERHGGALRLTTRGRIAVEKLG